MAQPDWATELGVHASDDALEAEIAATLALEGSKLTNRNALSAFWGVVRQVVVRPIRALETLLVAVVPMGFLRYAKGVWLDAKLMEFGKTRKPSVKATHLIAFSRTGTVGNVNIPAGVLVSSRVLADGTRKRLVSSAATVLPDGQSSVNVACQAEQPGVAYNLPAGAYTELATPVAGIEAVTNGLASLAVAGVDAETDAAALQRVLDDQQSGGEGWIGGALNYLGVAKAFPGVVDAAVNGNQPRGQGSVDVVIIGGGAPTPQLIADLTAYLDAQGKPITDDLLVRAPVLVPVAVTAEAVAYATDTRTNPAIQAAVEAILDSYFTYGVGARFLKLGEDYVRARVAGEAIREAALKNLRFTAPAADVAVAAGSLATAGARVVTVVREAP